MPVGIAHEGANRHDQKLLDTTLCSIPIGRPKPAPQAPQGLCLDRAYGAPPTHALAAEHGFTPHIRTRGEEIADKLRMPGAALGCRGLPLLAQPQAWVSPGFVCRSLYHCRAHLTPEESGI